MPGRLGAHYIAEDGSKQVPVMLHRAILGSLERFIALYTEMTGGDFPFWLAPVQAVVLPIAERHIEYARDVARRCGEAGLRVEIDARSEKLGFKIREAETQKIPLMLVVGDKEIEAGTVAPRLRHSKKQNLASSEVDALVAQLVDRQIPLTVCPQSNLRLAVIGDMRQHPLKQMLDLGLLATINSDDPAYFGGYMNENISGVTEALDLNQEHVIKLMLNGFEASFLDPASKQIHQAAVLKAAV